MDSQTDRMVVGKCHKYFFLQEINLNCITNSGETELDVISSCSPRKCVYRGGKGRPKVVLLIGWLYTRASFEVVLLGGLAR